jgi:hypothetical protein
MLTSVNGEFCRKKSIIPSGMGGGFKPALNAFLNFAASLRDLAATFSNMNVCIIQPNAPKSDGINSTSNDFKLHKEDNLTMNKSGTNERI